MKKFSCAKCGKYIELNRFYPFDGYQSEGSIYIIECRNCGIAVTNRDKEKCVETWNAIKIEPEWKLHIIRSLTCLIAEIKSGKSVFSVAEKILLKKHLGE